MDPRRKDRLADALTRDDPAQVAAALDELRLLDLGQPDLLALALRLTGDPRPLPSGEAADPFAAFFGDAPSATTLGDHAADALVRAGLPGFPAVADVLADALEGPRPARAATVARLLAEAPWDDRPAAVRRVLPALLRADASLFALVVSADEDTLDLLVAAASAPFRARLANELLNHEPARDRTLHALARAADHAEGDDAVQIVTLAHQWRWERAPELAATLAPRFPWASAFAALHDAAWAADVHAWCASADAFPPELPRLLQLVLRHLEPLPSYPLVDVLDRIDGACETVAAQDAVDRCADLLRRWVRAGLAGDRPDRGWAAATLLGAGRLGDLGPAVVDAVGAGRAPIDGPLLDALVGLPGLDRALAAVVLERLDLLPVVGPALVATASPDVLAAIVRRILDRAEALPVVIVPRRRGLIERRRDGVDLAALEPAIERLADPALRQRWDDLLPVIGPAG